MVYGYARVSTAFEQSKDRNQTFDRQEMILKEHGVKPENIFCDRISGGSKTSDRPAFDNLMSIVIPGDTIIVSEMSRLSRSLADLIRTIDVFIQRQIGVHFVKECFFIGTDGLNPMNRLMFQLLGAFNEFERTLIAERVHQGMQASKMKGNKLGRPSKISEEVRTNIIEKRIAGASYEELIDEFGFSRPTIASIVKGIKKGGND